MKIGGQTSTGTSNEVSIATRLAKIITLCVIQIIHLCAFIALKALAVQSET